MEKIGISSMALFRYRPEDAVKRASELGFTSFEIMLEGSHKIEDYAEVKELADSFDIELFVHVPFSDLNIASLNEGIRKETLSQVFWAIETADFLNSEIVTFHSGRSSPVGVPLLDEARAANLESIKEILRFSSDFDLKLCLENMPNFPDAFCCEIDDVAGILDVNPGLCLTLDIAHAHTCGDEIEFINNFKDEMVHVHLHDNSGGRDSHSAVGEGDIDFKRVLSHLKDFNGSGIIEAKSEEGAAQSMQIFEEIMDSL